MVPLIMHNINLNAIEGGKTISGSQKDNSFDNRIKQNYAGLKWTGHLITGPTTWRVLPTTTLPYDLNSDSSSRGFKDKNL